MVKLPLTSLANFLSSDADIMRKVTDKTGLAGSSDFTLAWTPESARGDASNPGRDGPSIFTAVQEQLGLKLVAKKGPDQVLVIDHVERPSANRESHDDLGPKRIGGDAALILPVLSLQEHGFATRSLCLRLGTQTDKQPSVSAPSIIQLCVEPPHLPQVAILKGCELAP